MAERMSRQTVTPLLLGGIAFELLFAAAVIYLPPLQAVFGTAALPPWVLGALVPMPVLVWGIDEAFRALRRRSENPEGPAAAIGPSPLPRSSFGAPSTSQLEQRRRSAPGRDRARR